MNSRHTIKHGICILALTLAFLSDGHRAAADEARAQRQEFLKMFGRAYFPGRSGQIFVVPREGTILTSPDPSLRFMHGSPWDYDTRIPLLFYGPRYINQGSYPGAATQQDIVPTLAALLKGPRPPTATGRPLTLAIKPSDGAPRVILLVVLDGMRVDYFDRYAATLPTLTRLRGKGAWFTEARINYIPSITSIGHTTIATGTDPRIHGITFNSTIDRTKGVSQEAFSGLSPRELLAPTLADLWNLDTDDRAVIIAQGSTPRAAVPLAGHGSCMINGRPVILASYNSTTGGWESNPECYRLPEYLKEKRISALWEGTDGQWRGHPVSNPDAARRSPLLTRFEADALVVMIEREPVGQDDVTDLVLANLKTPDYVGHAYGPNSPEIRETLAEQDRQLARIVQALESKAGANQYLVVISADHGMPSPPEERGNMRVYTGQVVDLLHKRFDPDSGRLIRLYAPESSQLLIDRGRLRQLGLKLSQIKDFLEAQPYVFAAYTEDEVRAAGEQR
jgi:hypothetical protein